MLVFCPDEWRVQHSYLNVCFSPTISSEHLLMILTCWTDFCSWTLSVLDFALISSSHTFTHFLVSTPAWLTSRLSFLSSPPYIWAWHSLTHLIYRSWHTPAVYIHFTAAYSWNDHYGGSTTSTNTSILVLCPSEKKIIISKRGAKHYQRNKNKSEMGNLAWIKSRRVIAECF